MVVFPGSDVVLCKRSHALVWLLVESLPLSDGLSQGDAWLSLLPYDERRMMAVEIVLACMLVG
jgi:hypothetical protein